MALIKCKGCGHMISDKAEACPKCGTPNVQETIAEQPQQTEPIQQEQPQDGGSIRFANIIIGVVVLLFIGGIIWYTSHKSDEHLNEYHNETPSAIEETTEKIAPTLDERQPSEALEMREKRQMAENIYAAYVETVSEFSESGEYFLYDITKDGIPELWVRHGYTEANTMLSVYTYNNGEIKSIYEDGAGHSFFSFGNNYVIQCYAHQIYSLYKLTYEKGKVVLNTIYEEVMELPERAEAINEKEVEFFPCVNTAPIKSALGITN